MNYYFNQNVSYDFNQNISYDFNSIPYFFVFCLYIRIFFFITNQLLSYNDRFYKLKNDKKQYVVKNIVKSINLAALSIYSLPYIVYPLVMSQNLNNGLMHITGLFYSSGDFIALMYVKDLPSTTKNHHKVTVFFSFLSLGIDFNNSSLGKLLFVYTMASANAFIVNYHLGSRFLYDKEDTLYMKKKARDVYGLTLFFNWGWHVYWFITNFNDLAIEHFFYLCILYPIVKDDIILFSWLCN